MNKFLKYLEIKNNIYSGVKDRQKLQLKKLKYLVKKAYENTEYYHRIFRENKIHPVDISKLSDLKKIPYLQKENIRTELPSILNKTVNIQNCRKSITSGSTGMPLTIYSDQNTASIVDAVWIRTHLQNKMKLTDKMAVLRHPLNFPKHSPLLEKIGLIKRQYISIKENASIQFKSLTDFKPDIIRSHPTSLSEIIRLYQGQKHSIHPRLIYSSAEIVDQHFRDDVKAFFGAELFDHYACNEMGLISWECSEHQGYHINSDSLLVEFLDQGEDVDTGESGEIVITDLNNIATPMLRYKLGDIGAPSGEKCGCGVTLPKMSIIEGRNDDLLYTIQGGAISPHLLKNYVRDIFGTLDHVKQFRITQERKNKLLLEFALDDKSIITQQLTAKLEQVIHLEFGHSMGYEVIFSENIEPDPSGKLRISNRTY